MWNRAWLRSWAGGSFEPVVEVDLGAFAKVGTEPALTAQTGQLPGPGPGDDEPVPADDVVGHGAGVFDEILSLVARGRIVHPTSSGVPIFDRDDITLIPITDLPPLPLGLVWATSRENPRIRALNETAQALTTAPDAQGPNTRASATPERQRPAGRLLPAG